MESNQITEIEEQIKALRTQLVNLRRAQCGERVHDYVFAKTDGTDIKLSEMFGDKQDLIVIHNMGATCRYCTLWADGLNGLALPIADRAGLWLVNSDEPESQAKFAKSRGWTLNVASAGKNSFTQDMGFHTEKDGYWPGFSTFRKLDDGNIRRIGFDYFGPGDLYCAIWPMMEFLDQGEAGWEPKFKY